ncbi:hypothetical protein D1BOALGB6SA_6326 [Olavius sp. associated proteobacterium Delta 1]|nr:hypothetical protein D1BOALGB6SA_6326 [Olavius sp. associated proteobacterium Delta 1]
MKRKLICTMLSVSLFVFLNTIPALAAIVSFNILDSSIQANESFGMEVFVFEDALAGDLTAFGFDVDPLGQLTLFSFDDYTIGPDYFDAGMDSYVAGLKDSLDPTAGTTVLLATLLFTAGPDAGTDTLNIEGIFNAFDYGLYYEDSAFDQSIVGSVDVTVVPLPAAVWLFGFGLVGVAVVNRKWSQNKNKGVAKT